MCFRASVKSLKLYGKFGLNAYFSEGGEGPRALIRDLKFEPLHLSPESLSRT